MLAALYVNGHANRHWNNPFLVRLFQGVDGPPSCAVTGYDHIDVELPEVGNRFRNGNFVGARQVKSSCHSVTRLARKGCACGVAHIYDPRRGNRRKKRPNPCRGHLQLETVHPGSAGPAPNRRRRRSGAYGPENLLIRSDPRDFTADKERTVENGNRLVRYGRIGAVCAQLVRPGNFTNWQQPAPWNRQWRVYETSRDASNTEFASRCSGLV
jgi:hypothetical protein